MKSRNLFKIGGLAIGGIMLGVLATGILGTPVQWMQITLLESLGVTPSMVQAGPLENRERGTASFQVAKEARPAAISESPEEADLKKLPPPMLPGQVQRPSKADLLDKCLKTPHCQAKAKQVQQEGLTKPRPAAREESPEEKALKQLPQSMPPKARHQQPRSDLLMPENTPEFLSWLNPFQVAPAYGQLTISSYYLTPGSSYTSSAYMVLYGARVYPDNRYLLTSYDSISNSNSENKPYAFLRFSVPATGTYLINVQASRGKAKLRHQYNGPIIGTWDFTAQPYATYDYVTKDNLAQGTHYFYFWPEASSIYVYSASLERVS